MKQASGGVLAGLEKAGRWLEDALLVGLLLALMVLACTQIVLRNGFDTGLVWADELLRLLLLWLAMLGAVAASRDNRQITIDVLSRFLGPSWLRWMEAVTSTFTCGVTAALSYYCAVFVSQSREFEDTVLGELPAWPFQVVLPAAFALISYRYALRALRAFMGRGPAE